jgi:steroid delta-isomerase-like uncharacterized protein
MKVSETAATSNTSRLKCALSHLIQGGDYMSIEENKAIVHRFVEDLWNAENTDAFDELVAADFISHNSTIGEEALDREGLKQTINDFQTALSGLKLYIEDMIAEGDKVSIRGVQRGTHASEIAGIPATGKEITVTWLVILRIEDSKVVERWVNWDELGFMKQLGAIPPTGESEG